MEVFWHHFNSRSEGARLMQQVHSGRGLFLPSTVLGSSLDFVF